MHDISRERSRVWPRPHRRIAPTKARERQMHRGPIPLLMHASIEPIAAIVLIASSWIFGFSDNGTAQAVTIIIGGVMLVSGAMTDWRLAFVRLIPLRAHFMT